MRRFWQEGLFVSPALQGWGGCPVGIPSRAFRPSPARCPRRGGPEGSLRPRAALSPALKGWANELNNTRNDSRTGAEGAVILCGDFRPRRSLVPKLCLAEWRSGGVSWFPRSAWEPDEPLFAYFGVLGRIV